MACIFLRTVQVFSENLRVNAEPHATDSAEQA